MGGAGGRIRSTAAAQPAAPEYTALAPVPIDAEHEAESYPASGEGAALSVARASTAQSTPIFRRLALFASTALTLFDQYSDGIVLVSLRRQSFEYIAIVLGLSVLVPQVGALAFLWHNNMANTWSVVRVLFFPFVALACLAASWGAELWADHAWFGDVVAFWSVMSMEPMYQLYVGCVQAEESQEAFWMTVAEGLVEAPSSALLTLYPAFLISSVSRERPSLLFAISLMASIVTITRTSVRLHFFKVVDVTTTERFLIGIWVKFPQVLSQVLGFALFAFLTRPLARDRLDLQEHSAFNPAFGFVLQELVANVGLLRSVSPAMSLPVAALLAASMVVGGPPGFLNALDGIRKTHAAQHLVQMALMAMLAANMATHEHLAVLDEVYPGILVVWAVSTMWSFVASWVIGGEIEVRARLERAQQMLNDALVEGDVLMARLLLDVESAEIWPSGCDGVLQDNSKVGFIDSGKGGDFKWSGVCVHEGLIYFCPRDASAIMVLEPASQQLSFIETSKDGETKWSGVCVHAGLLYFCPMHASAIMVLEPASQQLSFIETGKEGENKWNSVCVHEGLIYFCPRNASAIMVLEPASQQLSFIETGKAGEFKWDSLCVHEGLIYFCPKHASAIMVLEPASQKLSFIEHGKGGEFKWCGVCVHEGLMYFCPERASAIMVLEPASQQLSFIETGKDGRSKWSGVCVHEGLLYFCPMDASAIMVLEPASQQLSFIDTSKAGEDKWYTLCVHEGLIYFCPRDASAIMVLQPVLLIRFRRLCQLGLWDPSRPCPTQAARAGAPRWNGSMSIL